MVQAMIRFDRIANFHFTREDWHKYADSLTLSTKNDDKSIPIVAMSPPTKAVFLIPNLSVKIPAKAESRKVAPTVIDPTREAFVAASFKHRMTISSISKLFLRIVFSGVFKTFYFLWNLTAAMNNWKVI